MTPRVTAAPEPIRLSLAGRGFQFASADRTAVRFAPGFEPFASDANPEPTAAVYVVHPPEATPWPLPARDSLVWQTETWQMGRDQGGDYLLAIHVLPDESPLTVARFTSDFSRGDLLRRAGRHGAATPFAFNYPCDQVAVLNALAPHGICVVHAGAVAFEDRGLLFCGRSGAGKTTLSRLCRSAGAVLLNDDRQFIWIESGQAWLAPTPWHGAEPEINNRRVPLRAIFHLEQSHEDRATPIAGAEAAARLLGNTVAPFYRAEALEHTLALLDRVTALTPSYRLSFTPTAEAVRLCASIAQAAH